MSDPCVGDKFVATDNHAAAGAMGLPRTPMPVFYVTVSHVWPDHRKVQVVDGDYWLTFEQLERFFRPYSSALISTEIPDDEVVDYFERLYRSRTVREEPGDTA